MRTEIFEVGIALKSGTKYIGKRSKYHFFEKDCKKTSGYGYAGLDEEIFTAIFLEELKDIIIDLNGAKLIFHGRIAPFIISKCYNIVLKNFSIDYDRPFYTQGEIIKKGDGFIDLKIAEGFPYRVDNGCFIAVSETWENRIESRYALFQPFDPRTLSPALNGYCMLGIFGDDSEDKNPPMPINSLKAEELSEGIVRFYGEFPANYFEGYIIAFIHELREKNAILCCDCEKILVENVRLIHASAMGFVGMFCKDITLRRFDMFLDNDSKGIMTINADSVHCFHCSGKVLIEDCIFENMLDDAVNIHGNYNVVEKSEGNKLLLKVVAAYMENISWYKPGDKINIYSEKTQELKETAIIVSAEYPKNRVVELILESCSVASNGDTVENTAMPEIVIRNCITGRNRPRGFLLSSGGKTLVENCYFNNCACAIHFTGDTSYWYESGPAKDVTIRNCFFNDCGYAGNPYAIVAEPDFTPTQKEPYYHKNINIHNNIFKLFTGGALLAKQTDNITFKNNRFIKSDSYGKIDKIDAIKLIDCGRTKIDKLYL